jgi:hypothetical protein
MTEPLHDLLTRIADQAGPGPTDATLWDRARRARRHRRRRRAAALVAAGLAAVTALTAVGIRADRHQPPQPVEQPDRKTSGPGIPSVVYGVPGDGGLDLETDLALGPASVAIANPVGVYVVTADDGAYHRVRLPGYDAASYDAALPGVALSPDGTQLAFGWRSVARHADGRPLHSGLRVLSLTTGAVWSAHFGETFGVPDSNVYAWDLRWSPDARWLGASVANREVAGQEHWYALLEPSAGRVVDEMWHAKQWPDPPLPIMVSPGGRVAAMETDPKVRLATWSRDEWRTLSLEGAGLSTGRYASDGPWLAMAGDGLESGISLVDTRSGAVSSAPLPQGRYPYGTEVDLLAWTGERQVLAMLRAGTGPTTLGPVADLALLTLTPGPAEPAAAVRRLDADVVGQVEIGQTGSAFSFATDLLSAATPTRDFDAPPFVPSTGDAGPGGQR